MICNPPGNWRGGDCGKTTTSTEYTKQLKQRLIMFSNRQVNLCINNETVRVICNQCKSNEQCMSGMRCHVLQYITERLPNVTWRYDDINPQIGITANTAEALDKAYVVVNRAIRMRTLDKQR